MSRIGLYSLLSFLLATMLAFVASGQTTTAITGRVTDQSGAVVPNASIKAHNETTGQDVTTVTSSTGDFTFTELRPGLYDVSAGAAGFDTTVETAVSLHLDAVATVKLTLKPGSTTVSIAVHADEVLTTKRIRAEARHSPRMNWSSRRSTPATRCCWRTPSPE